MSRKWMAAAWLALVLALTGCAADKRTQSAAFLPRV